MLLACVLCAASLAVGATEPCPKVVRIAFPDVPIPPFYNGEGVHFETPPGYSVDWARKAVEQTGCPTQVELTRRPNRRILQELQYGEADIAAVMAPSPERLTIAVFPSHNGTIDPRMISYRNALYLWVRKGDTSVQWDGKVLRGPPGFKVGVAAGTVTEGVARKYEWDPEVGQNHIKTLQKLLLGRMPVALAHEASVASLDDATEDKLERLEPAVQSVEIYSPASKQFYAQYPEFMAKYWSAQCKLSRLEKAVPQQKRLPACR